MAGRKRKEKKKIEERKEIPQNVVDLISRKVAEAISEERNVEFTPSDPPELVRETMQNGATVVEIALLEIARRAQNFYPFVSMKGWEEVLKPATPGELKADRLSGKLVTVRAQVLKRSISPLSTLLSRKIVCNECTEDECDEIEYNMVLSPFTGRSIIPVFLPDECWEDSEKRWNVYTVHIVVADPPETLGRRSPVELSAFVYGKENADVFIPGDEVILTGILVRNSLARRSGFTLHVFGVKKVEEEVVISDSDLERLQRLASEPEYERKLLASFATHLWGLFRHKQAVLYSIAGGIERKYEGFTERGRIHTLLISDPGKGKSSLFEAVESIYPKTVSASGSATTGTGLIGSVSKDEEKGAWILTAGAMAMASGGVLLLDEIDKLPKEERKKLHEALERGIVDLHKATVHARVRTDATVIAAGNPKRSRYDPKLSVAENLDLSPAIVSRFDIILLNLHRDALSKRDQRLHDELSAELQLRRRHGGIPWEPPIPKEDLKKILVLAQKIEPEMGEEERKIIKEFFVKKKEEIMKLEEERGEQFPMPITPRMLQAIERIAEARARLHLRKKVTKEDVIIAIDLIEEMIRTLGWQGMLLEGVPDVVGGTGEAEKLSKAKARELIGRLVRVKVREIAGNKERVKVRKEQIVEALKEHAVFDRVALVLSNSEIEDAVSDALAEIADSYDPLTGYEVDVTEIEEEGIERHEEEDVDINSPVSMMLAVKERPGSFAASPEESVHVLQCPFARVREVAGKRGVWCSLQLRFLTTVETKRCEPEKCPLKKFAEHLEDNNT